MNDKTGIKLLPSRVEKIRLDMIDRNPKQPRQVFSEEGLRKLAANIKAFGYLMYAILVEPHPEILGRYMIVAGERRFRALKLTGVEEFDFHIAEGEIPRYLISLIENSNREDLNPMDEAEAYEECMRQEKLSVAQLSEYTGKHFTEIHRSLRLLKLAPKVKQLIREGKLTKRGAMHHLAQFKDLSVQIELAQKLIAGEDPPELDELLTRASKWGNERIAAMLPKTADGLIRRLLKFRHSNNMLPFVIRALMDLPPESQLEGWRHFTKLTRERFTNQLRELIKNLRALELWIVTIPETKLNPFGNAITSKSKENASLKETTATDVRKANALPPSKEAVLTAVPKVVPASVPVSASATKPAAAKELSKPAQSTVLKQDKPVHKKAMAESAPTINELDAARKVLSFISSEATRGKRTLLSKKLLGRVLGNGASPESVQDITIKALRLVRRYWRASPDLNHPETEAFIILVSRSRHDFRNLDFDGFVRVVMARDASPDPVSLERL